MPTDTTDTRLAITPAQVAGQLQLHLNTVYRLLRDGKIPSFYVGQQRRIRVSDLEEFMANGGAR
jgi:excisionase family DNA binding protein